MHSHRAITFHLYGVFLRGYRSEIKIVPTSVWHRSGRWINTFASGTNFVGCHRTGYSVKSRFSHLLFTYTNRCVCHLKTSDKTKDYVIKLYFWSDSCIQRIKNENMKLSCNVIISVERGSNVCLAHSGYPILSSSLLHMRARVWTAGCGAVCCVHFNARLDDMHLNSIPF